MTIRTELETKIAAMEAELVILKGELATGGTWLEKEWASLELWVTNLKAKVTAPTAPPPAA